MGQGFSSPHPLWINHTPYPHLYTGGWKLENHAIHIPQNPVDMWRKTRGYFIHSGC